MKDPKSCHITPILCSLHWLRITECIEYKLLSPTYKVLTTTQPPYLHNLISIQRPLSTHCSSVVTLARPPSSCSKNNWLLLLLCDTLSLESAPFFSSSTSIWYQFFNFLLTYSFTHHFFLFSFTTLYICNIVTLSLFHYQLKTYLFHKSYPRSFPSSCRTASVDLCLDRFFWATLFLILFFSYFLFLGPCVRLSWPPHQLLSAR